MMSKYKLIKKYPGSPELGTIVNYSEKHKVYNHNGGDYHTELPKHQVENLPEYWEKVKQKNYEILSYAFQGRIYDSLKPNSLHSEAWYCDRGTWVSPTNAKIHSIKRLSDGEVFTVGDEVIVGSRISPQTIKQFELDKGSIRFRFNEGCGALLKYFSDPKYSKIDIKEAISNSKLSIHGEYLHKSQLEYELDLN